MLYKNYPLALRLSKRELNVEERRRLKKRRGRRLTFHLVIILGRYDYLIAAVRFQRDVGHYILQQYMPCSYIVLLSWVSFWIEADCVGDRISIGVTLVLTIVLLQGSLNTNMPKVGLKFG